MQIREPFPLLLRLLLLLLLLLLVLFYPLLLPEINTQFACCCYFYRFWSSLVDWTYYAADLLIAMCLTGLRFILSFGDIVTSIQQQLLFNTAWSAQVLHAEDLQSTQILHALKELLALKKRERLAEINMVVQG